MTHEDDDRTGWSTRQLAEMVGTTVKTIRHYHQAGLLEEPERRENGYKTYGPAHVSRLLDILRMREIGFSVAQIGDAMRSDDPSILDAEALITRIDDSVRRLQAIREDLVASRDSDERWRPSPGFADDVDRRADVDHIMSRLMARHFTREAMAALRSVDSAPSPIDAEFEQLPADASDETITGLATRMGPYIRRAQAEHSMPERVVAGDRVAQGRAAQAMGRMLSELYNPAQLEVITRALDTNADPRRDSGRAMPKGVPSVASDADENRSGEQ